jgi:dihydrofolate reductase
MIKLIVCVDNQGGIGCENDLLFNIKEDMKFFKEMTIGHKVVMGYNTWLSLPKKPLPNRDNFILYDGDEEIEGATVLRNIEEVFELGKIYDIFIIGGAMVYNSIIHSGMLDEAYVTVVFEDGNADVFIDYKHLRRTLDKGEFIKDISTDELKAQIIKLYR